MTQSINELKSYTEYNVSTPTSVFTIGFQYEYNVDHVNVYVDGVEATAAGYTVQHDSQGTVTLTPAVPNGVVRLSRETDTDTSEHTFSAGAKFTAGNMDENFQQIRHSQQEVRDGFSKLSTDTYAIIDTLQDVGQAAQDAADAAEQAAQTANDAAAQVNDKVSYQDLPDAIAATPHNNLQNRNAVGAHTASAILDTSGKTQQEINNEWVSVERYGVRFNTTDDQSANLQQALNSGNNLLFPKSGTIYANNLTQTVNGQILYSFGSVVIQKNANGPIINSSANYPQIHNIKFRGGSSNTPEFTGDNLVFTGANPKFINCGSMWAAGRALKATGNAVVIRGSQDIWQTSDTTATGYDIEIGTSGVCTLYHQLDGIYTSQKTGGVLLVDTGSHSLKGGQIGKLNIKAGTKPSGVNGGMTMGCRILGDVNIEQSNTGFSNNQFSDITLTFAAGTSFCIVDASNSYSSGFTSVNNGNGTNNIVIQNNGTGADGFAYFKYGAGTSTRSLGMNFSDPTRAWKFDGSVILPNNQAFKIADNTGTERIIAILAANNNLTIGANVGTYTYFQGINLGLNSSGGTQVRVSDGFIAPFTDNAKTCGTSALRWSKSYTVDAHFFPLSSITPTINGEMVFEKTSDTQLKIKVRGSDGIVRSTTLTLV